MTSVARVKVIITELVRDIITAPVGTSLLGEIVLRVSEVKGFSCLWVLQAEDMLFAIPFLVGVEVTTRIFGFAK